MKFKLISSSIRILIPLAVVFVVFVLNVGNSAIIKESIRSSEFVTKSINFAQKYSLQKSDLQKSTTPLSVQSLLKSTNNLELTNEIINQNVDNYGKWINSKKKPLQLELPNEQLNFAIFQDIIKVLDDLNSQGKIPYCKSVTIKESNPCFVDPSMQDTLSDQKLIQSYNSPKFVEINDQVQNNIWINSILMIKNLKDNSTNLIALILVLVVLGILFCIFGESKKIKSIYSNASNIFVKSGIKIFGVVLLCNILLIALMWTTNFAKSLPIPGITDGGYLPIFVITSLTILNNILKPAIIVSILMIFVGSMLWLLEFFGIVKFDKIHPNIASVDRNNPNEKQRLSKYYQLMDYQKNYNSNIANFSLHGDRDSLQIDYIKVNEIELNNSLNSVEEIKK